MVLVAYDPSRITYAQLLKTFWEHHDPTQGMRQGNDVGTQYRSIILVADGDQRAAAEASKVMYQEMLSTAGYGTITDRDRRRLVEPVLLRRGLPPAVPPEEPGGYCPNHSTGVKLPDDFVVTPLQYVD